MHIHNGLGRPDSVLDPSLGLDCNNQEYTVQGFYRPYMHSSLLCNLKDRSPNVPFFPDTGQGAAASGDATCGSSTLLRLVLGSMYTSVCGCPTDWKGTHGRPSTQ
jgi:hypothetical protein